MSHFFGQPLLFLHEIVLNSFLRNFLLNMKDETTRMRYGITKFYAREKKKSIENMNDQLFIQSARKLWSTPLSKKSDACCQLLKLWISNKNFSLENFTRWLAKWVLMTGTSIMYLTSFMKVKSFLFLIYFFVLGKWAAVQMITYYSYY